MVAIGEGVFETLQIVDSRPIAITRHLDRLARSAATLGLQAPVVMDLRTELERHLLKQPVALGRLRLTWLATADGATFAIESAPTQTPAATVALAIGEWQVDEASGLTGLKTTAYADYLAAAHAARSDGFDDALLANRARLVCETTTANIFFVIDGLLCTPPTSSGCLPGIARGLVLDLCDVAEVTVPIAMLAAATEVFITSSLREVQPVSQIGTWSYPATGPVTAEVAAAWRALLDSDSDPSLR